MSKLFAKLNTENTRELFEKRRRYKNIVFGQGANNIVSFIDGEKILYGRMDQKFVPVEAHNSTMRPLINPADPTMSPTAFKFVTLMFRELVMQMQKQVALGKISNSDPYLSNLKVYKGFQNPRASYYKYMDTYSLLLKNLIYSNFHDKFSNFDEFMSMLLNILETSVNKQPFTYTGYIKSHHCSVMSSGLAIEIADIKHMNDLKKYQQFTKSENWPIFVNACNTYGFMIDYNAPWRIVADIGAPEILFYAKQQGYSSLLHILTEGFKPASINALRDLSKRMFDLYNFVKHSFYDNIVPCESGKILKQRIYPTQYTQSQFYEIYDEKYFLKIYLKLRMLEEAHDKPFTEREEIINHYFEMFEAKEDIAIIHQKFESMLNKTFDKRGSLSYSIYSDRLKTKQAFEAKDIDNIIITEEDDNLSGY